MWIGSHLVTDPNPNCTCVLSGHPLSNLHHYCDGSGVCVCSGVTITDAERQFIQEQYVEHYARLCFTLRGGAHG